MYYVVSEQNGQILECLYDSPNPKEQANYFKCDIYVIEGQHSGLSARYNVQPDKVQELFCYYGESLTDLGADYEDEFESWFSKEYTESYNAWKKANEETRKRYALSILFDICNDGWFIEFDIDNGFFIMLANFINQEPKAKRHIRKLMSEMEQ